MHGWIGKVALLLVVVVGLSGCHRLFHHHGGHGYYQHDGGGGGHQRGKRGHGRRH